MWWYCCSWKWRERELPDWRCVGSEAKTGVDEIAKKQRLSSDEKLELLTMENVRVQLNHLKNLR